MSPFALHPVSELSATPHNAEHHAEHHAENIADNRYSSGDEDVHDGYEDEDAGHAGSGDADVRDGDEDEDVGHAGSGEIRKPVPEGGAPRAAAVAGNRGRKKRTALPELPHIINTLSVHHRGFSNSDLDSSLYPSNSISPPT